VSGALAVLPRLRPGDAFDPSTGNYEDNVVAYAVPA